MNNVGHRIGTGIAALFVICLGVSILSAQATSSKLADVTSVYIQNDDEADTYGALRDGLRSEFQKRGLIPAEVSDRAPELSVFISVIITLHGGKNDLDIMIYDASLLGSDNEQLWKSRVKFATKGSTVANHAHAAGKIAERFKRAWTAAKHKSN